MFERIANFVVGNKIKITVTSIISALIIMSGASHITVDTDGRVFMAEENPDRIMLDSFEAEYSKDDNLNFILTPDNGEIYTPDNLKIIGEMTEQLWLLPYVRVVDSITNFQNTYSQDDDLIVEDLIKDPFSISEQEAKKAKDIALSRIELKTLDNPNTSLTNISVLFKLPGLDLQKEIPLTMEEANNLVDNFKSKYPQMDIKMVGTVAINSLFAEASQDDANTLVPLVIVASLIAVAILLRTFFGTAAVLLMIILTVGVTMGSLGWSGVPMNTVTAIAPLMVVTLAVASAVHILSSARQTMLVTSDRTIWAKKAISEHGAAISVACITTGIGFLSLNFSISPPFRQLGNLVAVGMVATLFFTLTILPALICWFPMRQNKSSAIIGNLMNQLAEFVIKFQTALVITTSLIILVLAYGISQIKFQDDFIRYFDERYDFRVAADYMEDNLGGLQLMQYSVNSGEPGGINEPDYLKKVEKLTDFLRSSPRVSSVRSITDTIKQLNMNMNGDNKEFYKIPDSREETSQYLFLYELSLGYGRDLTDQINIDKSSTRLDVYAPYITSAEILEFDKAIQKWFDDNAPELKSPLTGQTFVYSMISARDAPAMLQGTGLALIGISLIILLILRNVKLGFISLIPNLLPAIMGFGIWGYLMGEVTLAVSIVTAMTLGIVVDDSVHFMMKYSEGKKMGKSAEDSVRYAFNNVGMALLITSIGLVIGFAILAQSGFKPNKDLAALSAITLTCALFVDFLLLPPLLIWFDKVKTKSIPASVTTLIIAFGLTSLILIPQNAYAETNEEKGYRLFKEFVDRNEGFGDSSSIGTMTLKDSAGNESIRQFINMILEEPNENLGDKSITIFTEPRDIKGTATLTHSKIEPDDNDQWIYLPAIKRVKRISSSNRTGKFVGSEFSFEDLASQEIENNTYLWLEDLDCPNIIELKCSMIEARPKNKKSGYSKVINYIDLQEFRVQFAQFYNRRGDLEKELSYLDYKKYLDKYWFFHGLVMLNKQTGKSTELKWDEYKVQSGLKMSDFDPKKLPKMAK